MIYIWQQTDSVEQFLLIICPGFCIHFIIIYQISHEVMRVYLMTAFKIVQMRMQ